MFGILQGEAVYRDLSGQMRMSGDESMNCVGSGVSAAAKVWRILAGMN
jgi:hypothetical protein